MRFLSNPFFWLLFGAFGYPLVCCSAQFAVGMAVWQLDRMPATVFPLLGWGDVEPFYGVPLGVVSALSARAWQNERFAVARGMAWLGGGFFGAYTLVQFLVIPWGRWSGDIGFIVPPLVWAACLIIFAVFARPPLK